jgi:hypothetical protein
MTKHSLFWLAYAACLGVAVFWGLRLLPPRHRINPESFEKIQVGMTLEDVEAILGVPAGKYYKGSYFLLGPWQKVGNLWVCCGECLGQQSLSGDKEWIGKDGAIAVWLDSQERVVRQEFSDLMSCEVQERFFDKLLSWLRLSNDPGAAQSSMGVDASDD